MPGAALSRLRLPADAAPRASIVMVLTRDASQARAALQALAAAHDGTVPAETFLVLNAAEPDVRRLALEEASGARVLVSEANLGTACAWNEAVRRARGDYVVLVHEDAEVQPGWLAALVSAMEAEPRAAAAGARLLNPGGSLQNAGWILLRDGRPAPVVPAPARSAPVPVDFCSSATLLIERAPLLAAGGFDEGFFPAVYVEIAACTALWRSGRAVVSVPDAVAVHRRGAMVRPERGALASERFRTWLMERHRARFADVWAQALPGFEPCDAPWPVPADVVRRGLERAHGRLDALPPPAGAARAPAPAAAGPGAEEVARDVQARCAERLRAVALEFLEWAVPDAEAREAELATAITAAYGALDVHVARGRDLERQLGEAGDRIAGLEAERARLREASRTLDAVLAGRWWRLRTALRRAGRLRGPRRP